MKKKMLELLKGEMKEMMYEDKNDLLSELMPKEDAMQKVTVMSDSKEGLMKGLSKAEQIMKAKMEYNDKKKKKEE